MINNVGALALDAKTVEYIWQVPLLGMAMVFAVLGILWAVLSVFKLVFSGKTPKAKSSDKPQKAADAGAAPAIDDATLAIVLGAAITAYQNDDQTVAAITAAVAAYRAENGESSDFRVVSFKRTSKRAWNTK